MHIQSVDEHTNIATLTLPAGTVIKINGIPLELVSDASVRTHHSNVKLIEKPLVPTCGERAADWDGFV